MTEQNTASSAIAGAISLKQLQENFDSAEVVLSVEVLEKIEAVHKVYPNPGLDAVISCQRFHVGMFVIAAFKDEKIGAVACPDKTRYCT